MHYLTTLVLAALLACSPRGSTSAPTDAPTSATPPTPGGSIVCNFAWRNDVTVGFAKGDSKRIEIAGRSGRTDFVLGELAVSLSHDLDAAKDPGVQIAIDDKNGAHVLADRYVLAGGNLPANLPASGHGFTGLAYVTPPDGSGELQFQCVVARPGDQEVDDGWVIGKPGSAAAAGRHVTCTFDLDDGAHDRKRLALGPETEANSMGTRGRSARLGPFAVTVTHMPGGHESGAVIVDVAVDGGAAARAFYQTTKDELPSDFAAGHTGFSGIRTHHTPVGAATPASLSYVCTTAA